ncbi:hypothetical protein Tco_1008294 [Tanacetum coccineum]
MEAKDRMKKRPRSYRLSFRPMTSRFEAWNEKAQVLKTDHFDYGGPRSYEEKAFIQNGITRSERLDFRPLTSLFESLNGEVLCKKVSLIDAGPSVEEQTILFKEAQDRLNVEEEAILIMEAQDHMKKRPLFKMA